MEYVQLQSCQSRLHCEIRSDYQHEDIKHAKKSNSLSFRFIFNCFTVTFYLSRDLINFMISFIFSFEIINVVIPDLFWILFCCWCCYYSANGLSTFIIIRKLVFSNYSRSLPRNLPNCTILDRWVFDNFILADELFRKVLRSLQTCVLVNNNLCRKLVSSLESSTIFDESFKVTWVSFFIPNFNFWSYELNNFTFKVLYWVVLYSYHTKIK